MGRQPHSIPQLFPALLRAAYSQGYFPMPDPNTHEIHWYRPDPRAILPLKRFHCSRSLHRKIRNGKYEVKVNSAFTEVMQACAAQKETWITPEFIDVYSQLHREGDAHSIEIWRSERLVGGLYGVALGGAFFGESMFHRETDTSKLALYHLVERLKERGFHLLEIQFLTAHLASLGGIEVSDRQYQRLLGEALRVESHFI